MRVSCVSVSCVSNHRGARELFCRIVSIAYALPFTESNPLNRSITESAARQCRKMKVLPGSAETWKRCQAVQKRESDAKQCKNVKALSGSAEL